MWGANEEEGGEEHYWIRSNGFDYWRSLCSSHTLQPIEKVWGVYYAAVWADQNRERAVVCEKCRKLFPFLKVSKIAGEVAPKPWTFPK